MKHFKAFENAKVIDLNHPRFGQSGVICGFKRNAEWQITNVEISFHPHGPEGPHEWFTTDQVEPMDNL